MKFAGMAAGCCLEGSAGARECMRVGGARCLMISESSKSRSSISPSEGSESLSETSSMRGCDISGGWCCNNLFTTVDFGGEDVETSRNSLYLFCWPKSYQFDFLQNMTGRSRICRDHSVNQNH